MQFYSVLPINKAATNLEKSLNMACRVTSETRIECVNRIFDAACIVSLSPEEPLYACEFEILDQEIAERIRKLAEENPETGDLCTGEPVRIVPDFENGIKIHPNDRGTLIVSC